jgi:hypothetical protein
MALMMTGCQGLGRFTCVMLTADAMDYYMEEAVGAGNQVRKIRLLNSLSIVIILTNGGKNLTLPEILNFRHPQCRF